MRLSAVNPKIAQKPAAFFDDDRPGMHVRFERTAPHDPYQPPASHDSGEMSFHDEGIRFHRCREMNSSVLIHQHARSMDVADQRGLRRQDNFPLRTERARDLALDTRRSTDDPRAAQSCLRADEEISPRIDRTGCGSEKLYIDEIDPGIASRANRAACVE